MTLSKPLVAAIATLGILFSVPTLGAGMATGGDMTPKFYLGAGAGRANLKSHVKLGDLGDVRFSDDSTAYKIFAGYRAARYFGIEGGYRNFGKADAGPFSVKTDGFDVAAVGFLPVGPVDLFAKGGVIFWNTDSQAPAPNDSGQDLMYGVGGQLNLGSLFLRLESEWFKMAFPEDAQMITGSVGWVF
ncbi:MAG: outer membrane beta-barrel protein [Arenicellales bacterium]